MDGKLNDAARKYVESFDWKRGSDYDQQYCHEAFIAGARWHEEQLNAIPDISDSTKKRICRIKYCDDCIHFKPKTDCDDNCDDFDFSELCELGKKLKFKMPPEDDLMSYDYGFYWSGCKDYKFRIEED